MTRRERMERRAQRRLEWAESRDRKAAAALANADSATAGIPLGQPILVGHHSESRHRRAIERSNKAMHAAVESTEMAKLHRERAANIEHQLDRTIYSDDVDAITQLEERIEERERERNRIKRYNDSCRLAVRAGRKLGDLTLLNEKQKADLLSLAQVAAWQMRSGGAFPSYVLSNLAGKIKADRERLAKLKAGAPCATT
jgi:hypothetical protein